MRNILFVIFILFIQCSPKHITKQSQVTSVATVLDCYDCTVNKQELLAKPYVTISNNNFRWKIIRYDLTFAIKGYLCYYGVEQDTFPKEAVEKIDSLGSFINKIFIDHIKAVNKNNDTIFLNPIALKIKKG